MTAEGGRPRGTRVRIWDLPVRISHWAIALLFAVQWWTGETGRLGWHRLAGYAVIGLVVFRLLWGLLGSSTARFASFVRGPRAVFAYLAKLRVRGDGRFRIGHNPLGGWSVVLMLALLAVQAGLGLYAIDTDGLESGPLAARVSFETARTLVQHFAGGGGAARDGGRVLPGRAAREPGRADADRRPHR